jgi:hypothetical protein
MQMRIATIGAARLMDAGLPEVVVTPPLAVVINVDRPHGLPDNGGMSADVVEPQRHLIAPALITESTSYEFDVVTGLLSPAAWVRLAGQKLFHMDPFQFLLTPITGAWGTYQLCAVAWGHAESASGDMASNLFRVAKELPLVWRGNAASALQVVLVLYAEAFDRLAAELMYYRQAFWETGEAARLFFEGLSPLLEMFLDSLIIAAIAAELGAATFETVVGAIAGGAVAVFYLHKAYQVYQTAVDELGKFQSKINLLAAGQAAFRAHQTWRMPRLVPGPSFKVD